MRLEPPPQPPPAPAAAAPAPAPVVREQRDIDFGIRKKPNPRKLEEVRGRYENDSNQNTCVICQDNVSIMAVIPCGHLCLCNECSEVCMGGQNGQRTCPICRGNMQSVLRIYSGN